MQYATPEEDFELSEPEVLDLGNKMSGLYSVNFMSLFDGKFN